MGEGDNLEVFVKKHAGAIDRNVALSIVYQIAHGLEYVWRHNVVHHDVKGLNIMIVPTDSSSPFRAVQKYDAVLCDFGHSIPPEKFTPLGASNFGHDLRNLSEKIIELLGLKGYTYTPRDWSQFWEPDPANWCKYMNESLLGYQEFKAMYETLPGIPSSSKRSKVPGLKRFTPLAHRMDKVAKQELPASPRAAAAGVSSDRPMRKKKVSRKRVRKPAGTVPSVQLSTCLRPTSVEVVR